MCKNLVLRRALKNAPKSIEMRNIVEGDEKTDADISSAFDGMPTGSETPEQKQIGQQQAENDFFGDEPQEEEQPPVEEKPKRGRKKSEPVAEEVAQVELG